MGSQFEGFRVLSHVARNYIENLYQGADADGHQFLLWTVAKARVCESDWSVRTERQSLVHPGITRLFKVGETEEYRYGVFEYVDGDLLSRRLNGPLPSRDAAAIMQQVALILHGAHSQGWCHGHLTAWEVLLTKEGQPKLWDFQPVNGLAAFNPNEDCLFEIPRIIGGPAFMAPEQVKGNVRCSVESDVYALGATLYFLVTARPPFKAEPLIEVLMKVVQEPPVPPRQVNPLVDRKLDQIILKCLQKRPDARYRTAAAVADVLSQFVGRSASGNSSFRKAWRILTQAFRGQ